MAFLRPTLLALALTSLAAGTTFAHHRATRAAAPPAYDSNHLGGIHHPVTTRSAEAQRLFDQGLALCFAFNHDEAVRSFERALRADSTLAMGWWGIAYALGPNINLPCDSATSVRAWAAVGRAQALAAGAGESERAYIDAMAKRWAPVPPADRSGLDRAWREAMRDVARRFPDDPDAGSIYAESIMDLTPWNYWDKQGRPLRPDTDEFVAVLRGVLAKHPMHTAANHYYVHAMEGSAHPESALASVNRLRTLAPDAGHLVHMPAHILDRIGEYWDATNVNVNAARVDSAYVTRYKVEGIYPLMYWTHNHDFAANGFMRTGRYAPSIAHARKVSQTGRAMAFMAAMLEGMGGREYFVLTAFHRWPELLAARKPAENLVMTRLQWEWARGTACAATGRLAEARAHLAAIELSKRIVPADYPMGFNSAPAVIAVAHGMLVGAIARAAGELDASETAYRAAVAAYDTLRYDEPEDWWLPPREALGGVLLAKHDFSGAEQVFRDELTQHLKSGRALFGLAAALDGQQRTADAAGVRAQLRVAWSHADRPLRLTDL